MKKSFLFLSLLILIPTVSNAADSCTFTRSLYESTEGTDVQCLQTYLQAEGIFPSDEDTTMYFGPITKQALITWQQKNAIEPAIGYFGPISQATYNRLTASTTQVTEITVPVSTSDRALLIESIEALFVKIVALFDTITRNTADDQSKKSRSTSSEVLTISLQTPASNATVSGSVILSAVVADGSDIRSVQFAINGTSIGSEDTTAPYSIAWDSTTVTNGSYSITATVTENSGDSAASDAVTVLVDNTGPGISSISEEITSTTTATITWTTDQVADSQVEYGLTDSYGSTTTLDATLTTSHSVSLSGLLPDYTYYYRVLSADAVGNLATSSNQTFSTLSAYGAGTFFADTFERDDTSPLVTPGSIANGWIDKEGSTYFIQDGQLKSTDYSWEESLYREFSSQDWSSGDLYGFIDLDDAASASSTRVLAAYATTTIANWRSFTSTFGVNGGFRYLGVGQLYNVNQFFDTGSSQANWTHYDDHVHRMTFSLTNSGGTYTFTGTMLNIADPDNPIVLGTKTSTRAVVSQAFDTNVLGFAGNLASVSQIVLSDTIPTWSSDSIAYDNAALYYSSNNWYDTGSSYRTVNPGAYVKFKFTGTRLAIDITTKSQNNYLEWQIDDGEYKVHEAPLEMTNVSLAQGLEDTTHEITIWFKRNRHYSQDRWTAGNTNSIEITGFDVDSGKSITAPTTQSETALFFGDSITEAAVATGELNSGRETWSAQLAELMGVEHGQVGFSYQGWTYMLGSSNVGDFEDSWDYYYDTNSRLSSGEFIEQPDYIFLNHGQNDVSYGGNDAAAVETATENMLAALRTAAPDASIFLVVPFTGAMRTAITNAFNDYQDVSPDADTYLIDLGLNGPPDYDSDDNLHPTPEGAAAIAELMQTAVNSALGL